MELFFANPWMVAALVAVTLPIIIEWLFRRRKRQVDLPTIRFLLRNKEQERIRRQDRILLLLRMLAIFLLVMAVARPLIQHGLVGGARQRHIVVLLDGTASTNQQVGVTTAFGIALCPGSFQRQTDAFFRHANQAEFGEFGTEFFRDGAGIVGTSIIGNYNAPLPIRREMLL